MQFSSGNVIYKNKTHLESRIWKRVSSVYLRKHFHCIFWQWECCVLTANRTSSTISVQIVSGNRLLFLAILFRFPCVCVCLSILRRNALLSKLRCSYMEPWLWLHTWTRSKTITMDLKPVHPNQQIIEKIDWNDDPLMLSNNVIAFVFMLIFIS